MSGSPAAAQRQGGSRRIGRAVQGMAANRSGRRGTVPDVGAARKMSNAEFTVLTLILVSLAMLSMAVSRVCDKRHDKQAFINEDMSGALEQVRVIQEEQAKLIGEVTEWMGLRKGTKPDVPTLRGVPIILDEPETKQSE